MEGPMQKMHYNLMVRTTAFTLISENFRKNNVISTHKVKIYIESEN